MVIVVGDWQVDMLILFIQQDIIDVSGVDVDVVDKNVFIVDFFQIKMDIFFQIVDVSGVKFVCFLQVVYKMVNFMQCQGMVFVVVMCQYYVFVGCVEINCDIMVKSYNQVFFRVIVYSLKKFLKIYFFVIDRKMSCW